MGGLGEKAGAVENPNSDIYQSSLLLPASTHGEAGIFQFSCFLPFRFSRRIKLCLTNYLSIIGNVCESHLVNTL